MTEKRCDDGRWTLVMQAVSATRTIQLESKDTKRQNESK